MAHTMNTATMIFGNYADTPELDEGLMLHFSSILLSRQHQWLNNSLTANFLAEYWSTFSRASQPPVQGYLVHAKDVISYVVNELLDNAIKYGCVTADNATRILVRFALLPQHIRVYVTNQSLSQNWRSFQEYITLLLTENSETLYFRQMEDNALSKEHAVSRLGLLSILHDYHGRIGWKIESPVPNVPEYTITTMVQIPMSYSP